MSASNNDILILQRNLSSLRKLAHWTAEELGDSIGVTKQTISNLETGRTKMSKTQYIAIRTVFDYMAQSNEELKTALSLVLDNHAASQEEQEVNETKVRTAAAALNAGVNNAFLSAIMGAVTLVAAGAWLTNLMKKDQ